MPRFLDADYWQHFWQTATTNAASRGLNLLVILIIYFTGRAFIFRLIDLGLARFMSRQAGKSGAE